MKLVAAGGNVQVTVPPIGNILEYLFAYYPVV